VCLTAYCCIFTHAYWFKADSYAVIHVNTIPTLHFMDISKLISVMQNCSPFNYITIQITSLNKIEPSKLKQVWIEYIMTSLLTILHVLLFILIIQQRWTITANIYKTISQKMACPNDTLLKQYVVFTFFTTVKHLRTEFDYLITYLLTYLPTYLHTYLFLAAESFLRS
jgi:hypothetical protein